VEGNNLKFDLKVEKPMKITLKYNLVVEGDKISGKVKMGIFGSAKLSGTQSKLLRIRLIARIRVASRLWPIHIFFAQREAEDDAVGELDR